MITIYTKKWCPFCLSAKSLLEMLSIDIKEIDIYDNDEKKQKLFSVSNMKTFPQIFIWDITFENLIWWYSELKTLYDSWELDNLLKKDS